MTGRGRDSGDERWFDQEAGPVVRPYALTKGRTATGAGTPLGLIDVVAATGGWPRPQFRPGPEHRRIMELCQWPKPVIDLASETDLPVGVVCVLIGDLIDEGLLRVLPAQRKPQTDQRLLRMVLDGLQSLLPLS
jgi:Protein of unknown function (DUF742)